MARTTAAEVKAVMDNCTVADAVVDVLIESASALVTKILGTDAYIGSVLLESVEMYFTAHMIASTLDRTTKSVKIGQVSAEYTGTFRENLSSTPYGQMVLTLDFTGKMGDIGKKRASIHAITSFD